MIGGGGERHKTRNAVYMSVQRCRMMPEESRRRRGEGIAISGLEYSRHTGLGCTVAAPAYKYFISRCRRPKLRDPAPHTNDVLRAQLSGVLRPSDDDGKGIGDALRAGNETGAQISRVGYVIGTADGRSGGRSRALTKSW